ncbi:hypothetical protein Salat_2887700 [Sesamum alatum]|uniref:Uncharacterized protein n=1 Tax=Sesamum alatum TaxID=300844 RepID=A0AAE1XJ93_9LAMI|nr:hypothetical protein Salat_2887700 [Sesamum alatum]
MTDGYITKNREMNFYLDAQLGTQIGSSNNVENVLEDNDFAEDFTDSDYDLSEEGEEEGVEEGEEEAVVQGNAEPGSEGGESGEVSEESEEDMVVSGEDFDSDDSSGNGISNYLNAEEEVELHLQEEQGISVGPVPTTQEVSQPVMKMTVSVNCFVCSLDC